MTATKVPARFLPYGRQHIDEADIEAVISVLKSDYLTTGPTIPAFERALIEYVQSEYSVCVNSGTAALHAAMAGLGVGVGDWVIIPSITFLATANAARWCGAEVIFADVDSDNGLMGPEQLQQTFDQNKDKKIKAVVPVHLCGQTENLAEIRGIAQSRHCGVIEDACHAIGTEYVHGENYRIGDCRYSDAVAFSFHPVKVMAMGEGGAITTNRRDVYDSAMLLRNHGMNRHSAWHYEMTEIGLNYRSSDLHCALGLSQLKKLPLFIEKRRALVALYDQLLEPLFPFIRPIKKTLYSKPAWHIYCVLIDFNRLNQDRARVVEMLKERHIGTQVHYFPVHEQPYYEKRYGKQSLSGARNYYERTLTLPLFPEMGEEDVEYVVDSLKRLVELR